MHRKPERFVLPARTLGICVGIAAAIICVVVGCTPAPTPPIPDRAVSAEEELCLRFARLKNARDPGANQLLGPRPTVPPTPVTEAEAQRLDTEIFLRQDFRVLDVRPGEQPGQCVLVVDGNLMSEPMRIGTDGVSTRQIVNPDLVVEVRDGKIHGVLARLHREPNHRPLTPEESDRLRRLLIGEGS